MSGPDNRPGAQPGQDDVPKKSVVRTLLEWLMETVVRLFWARQRMLHFGIVSREDLANTFGVSPETVRLWESNGLEPFRPGTREHLFLIDEVVAFIRDHKSLKGKPKQARRPDGRRKEET